MLIATLRTQTIQRNFQFIQIIHILATWPAAANNVFRKCLRILRPEELWVVRQTNVDQTLDLFQHAIRCVGRMYGLIGCRHVLIEGSILNAIPIDLSDVEILFHLSDVM